MHSKALGRTRLVSGPTRPPFRRPGPFAAGGHRLPSFAGTNTARAHARQRSSGREGLHRLSARRPVIHHATVSREDGPQPLRVDIFRRCAAEGNAHTKTREFWRVACTFPAVVAVDDRPRFTERSPI